MRKPPSGFSPVLVLLLCVLGPFAGAGTVSAAAPFTPVGTIILDAGHGGHDPGAVATWDGATYHEKDLTLDIVLRMRDILARRAPDLTVLLTRESDVFVSLDERVDFATDIGPAHGMGAVFVSLHVNSAYTDTASGYELLVKQTGRRVTFLDEKSPLSAIKRWSSFKSSALNVELDAENEKLARSVRASLGTFFPTGKDRGIIERDIYVLNYSRMPSVLVEVGFLSNKEDSRNLLDEEWRQKMAAAIVSGLLAYRSL